MFIKRRSVNVLCQMTRKERLKTLSVSIVPHKCRATSGTSAKLLKAGSSPAAHDLLHSNITLSRSGESQSCRPCHDLHGTSPIFTLASWSCGSQGSRSACLCFRLFRGGTFTWETGSRSGAQRSSLCGGRFPFLCNQREAASFSIHSASSFTLKPYLAWRLRKS